jgi:hypothetical protein
VSAPQRERIGRFRLRNIAADAMRFAHLHDGPPAVDCPQCTRPLTTRRPYPAEALDELAREGSALHSVLFDHLFHDCPATEVDR